MGKLINGINGPFTGTVGTVVGSSHNGEPHLKGKYKKRTKKITAKEKGNRGKFNPALMKMSYGDLPVSKDIAVALTDDGYLQFSWDTADVPGGSGKDQVMMLAYDIENRQAMYHITGQLRSTGSDRLRIYAEKGLTYHVYCAFNAADRSKTSDSIYMGTISI